ncbi:MAG: tRNA/rRNA methyltransferase (SpoU) [Candidatus Roizmanbacteria bacterium GW2011_GWA2_37_7]|uniref:tRNA/rRNA methyltransferase (SpoU) n=1 Tax=Candidatus Roizmanbacteria bacterium GW2011_GWA2_37_7 TaxID=1618481 RepID=A0A0G0HE37_9BACT|nr:MAG: tRNA/rRNA methyltransferase (SpoU) [Candidatus Roizmanbacteria bacterium GW2011_GWA2_37_7]
MNIKLQTYRKSFPFSYSYGSYATIELMTHCPEYIQKVIFHSKSGKNKGVQKIKNYCIKHAIKTEMNDGLLKHLSGKENTYVLGVFSKYQTAIDISANHLMLVQPSDTGNLGSIIRTMLGYEIRNLAIIRPSVDIFDPKVVRASMGAVFQIQFEYFDSIDQYMNKFQNNLYSFMTDGSHTLSDTIFQKPYTLIFGNESSGLPASFNKISKTVRIEQSSHIDSLNLAMSVGIGLYESFKQKKIII